MRLAEIEDWRRRLAKRDPRAGPILEIIEINELPGLEALSFEPQTGFLAICGGTGSGKSAVLQLLHTALSALPVGQAPLAGPRYRQTSVRVRATAPGVDFDRTISVGQATVEALDGFDQGAEFIGLSDRTSNLTTFFNKSDVEVLKEGITPSEFDADQLASASSTCRKDYEKIAVFEIEGPDDRIYPFFEVTEAGKTYDSLSLSTGELSALYIIWATSSAEPFSFVLIEEPEAFLPNLSHNALFGFLSRVSVERRLGLLLSTHAPSIASHVPRKNIFSMVRAGGESTVLGGSESRIRALARLGLRPSARAILFVEDALAKAILSEIQGLYEFDAVCGIEIVDVGGGAGGIKNALEHLPEGITSVQLLGVLDGDMEAEAKSWDCADRLLFLPFRAAAEQEFIKDMETNPARFGRALSRSERVVLDALEQSRGDNFHDRFNALHGALGHSKDTITSAALAHWIKRASRKAHVRKFATRLARSLGVDLPSEV